MRVRHGRRRVAVVAAAVGVLVGVTVDGQVPVAVAATASGWEVVDLGTVPGGTSSSAMFVNDRGVVVGSVVTASGQSHAARWDRDGRVVELPSEGAQVSWPVGLNARGEVAGILNPTSWNETAVRWDVAGRLTVLAPLPGDARGYATGIAGDGSVVGVSTDQFGTHRRAVRWAPDGAVVELGVLPGGANSMAFASNDRGEVTGTSDTASGEWHAVRWDRRGRITDLGPNTPRAINDRGEVAGYLGLSTLSPDVRSARWDVRGQVVVGEAPAGNTAFAVGINNRGTTIGNTGFGNPHALRWDRAGAVTVLAEPVGVYSSATVAINDRDEVVGTAQSENPETVYAVHWDRHGSVTNLGALPGFAGGRAEDINRRGDVVGSSQTADFGTTRATLWRTERHGHGPVQTN